MKKLESEKKGRENYLMLECIARVYGETPERMLDLIVEEAYKTMWQDVKKERYNEYKD